MRKPSAASRTVDLFSGKTAMEEAEAEAMAKAEDVEEHHRPLAEPIEKVMDARRDNCFEYQESLSKLWDSNPNEKFRLTRKGDWMFLETIRHKDGKEAYAWTGVMFRYDSLYEITSVFYAAAKEKKASEATR